MDTTAVHDIDPVASPDHVIVQGLAPASFPASLPWELVLELLELHATPSIMAAVHRRFCFHLFLSMHPPAAALGRAGHDISWTAMCAPGGPFCPRSP
jgi:hypothetical protein